MLPRLVAEANSARSLSLGLKPYDVGEEPFANPAFSVRRPPPRMHPGDVGMSSDAGLSRLGCLP